MVTLSVAMIVRDEADRLADVIADTALFRDELIIVDTGSTDGTVAIAQSAGATVVHFDWIDDFAAARNASLAHCTGDWIMWLDADDRIPVAAQQEILAMKPTLNDGIDAVYAVYQLFDPKSGVMFMSAERERFFRRAAGLRWVGAVHEAVEIPSGRYRFAPQIWIEHRPGMSDSEPNDRNLKILQRMIDEGDRSPRTHNYYAYELRTLGRLDEAVAAYEKYFPLATDSWEEYDARISVALCLNELDRRDEAYDHAMQAIADDPSRAEALMTAGLHHFVNEQWHMAAPLFLAATRATRPLNGLSFDANYRYLPWDYLGVCLHQLGDQSEAIAATVRAIELGSPDADRLKANIAYMTDEL